MLELAVDQELCVGCGACVDDCVRETLVMNEGRPVVSREREEECIGCQHCLAVCPTGALGIMGIDPKASLPVPARIPSESEMEMLIKSRRSTRQYHQEQVDPETLTRLLEITAYAPTGGNSDQVCLTVIDHPDTMAVFREQTYAALRHHIDQQPLPDELDNFIEIAENWKKGKDFLFRGAPQLVVASEPVSAVSPIPDCLIALTYFELQAATMGLGTTWCGLVKTVLTRIAPELVNLLNIPQDHEIGYVMLFGRPKVRYHRTVQRNSDRVNYIRL